MKYTKIIAVLSALTLLAGCSEKKKPESSSEITGEPVVEDVTEENVYKTYNCDDFKKIDVPWNETDSEPPVELKRYVFPELNFGKKISAYMKTDDPFRYYANDSYYNSLTDENMKKQIYEDFMSSVDIPQKGVAEKIQRDGNKLYVTVNYDRIFNVYEWSMYCIDMDTDEVSEVYTYSGLEEQGMFWFWDAAVADNVLYIPNGQRDENGNVIQSCITAIDLDTKEENVIFESSTDLSLYKLPDGNLLISEVSDSGTDNFSYNRLEYDTKAKKITEKDMSNFSYNSPVDTETYLEKPENSRKLDLVTENYRLSTGITAAELLFADENRVVLLIASDKNILHTFDFTKMEHYVTELNSNMGIGASFGEGIVLANSYINDADVYYFIPDLGLAFTIAENIHYENFSAYNDTVSFTEMTDEKTKENGIEYTVSSEYSAFCWLERKD